MERVMGSESYEVWLEGIQKDIDGGHFKWRRVGIWSFPTKDNTTFSEVVAHYCRPFHKLCMDGDIDSEARCFDSCHACNEVTPDGIKMIALLEKL